MSRFKVGNKVIIFTYGKDKFMITSSFGVIKKAIVDGVNNSLYQIILNNQQKIEAFEYQIFTEEEADREFKKWLIKTTKWDDLTN